MTLLLGKIEQVVERHILSCLHTYLFRSPGKSRRCVAQDACRRFPIVVWSQIDILQGCAMSLFPLDAVRNASIDREIEPVLEDVREEIARFPRWSETGLGEAEEILAAFDVARPRLNVLAAAIVRARARSCVDVGTGLGFLPAVLSRLGVETIATEADPAVSAFLQARGNEVLEYRIGRTAPPIARQSADVVVFAEVLEHLKVAPGRALGEIAGLLRPGGRLLLTTPNIARLAHLEALAAGENFLESFPEDLPEGADPTDYVEHVREYSLREVVDAVESVGLAIDRVLMTGWGVLGYEPLPNPYANEIIVLEATV
jgi:2-polyprenyl-3-methyl-5-hydroxy-6-metoxy-1,4-benzoquinol methylase